MFFSDSTVAANPEIFVSVRTGIENASQKFTKSIAFLHPSTVRALSNSSAALPSSPYTLERLATAPTVMPFKRMNPVTMSFAYSFFVSKKTWLSEIAARAMPVSSDALAISAQARFRSSVHSV